MSEIYRVVLKRHKDSNRPDVCIFYDEDSEKAIKEMKKYNDKNGFSIQDKDGRFTIANIILRKTTGTGEVLSETSYRELYDVYGNRRKKVGLNDSTGSN